jgi:hypothetical protein
VQLALMASFRCWERYELLFVDDRGLLAAVGVAAVGVVAVHPAEHCSSTRRRVGPGVRALQRLALERGVERLGQRVVGAGTDHAHRLGQAPREAVDHRRQVQVRAVGQREVSDIADVALGWAQRR